MKSSIRFAVSCAIWLAIFSHGRASMGQEPGKFFSVSIRPADKEEFLYREEVKLLVTVTNPTKQKLDYMQGGKLVSNTRVEVLLAPEGLSRTKETGGGPFVGDSWARSLVRELGPGESIGAVYSFSWEYLNLPPGRYEVAARLQQFCDEFGVAVGETVSNMVEFSIVPWKAKRTSIREFQDAPFGKRVAGLIQTANGDTLAAWRRLSETDVWGRVIPVGKDIPLDKLLWAADRHACVIAVPDSMGEKTELIVAHKHNSNVERFLLKERPTYPGLNVPGSPWDPPVPVKPETAEQEGAPDALAVRHGGWVWLVAALACGGLGAAVGGVAVWLLMRRKRGAS